MHRHFLALPIVILLLAPAGASATHLSVPEGNGATNEYTEHIPGAGGNQPSGGGSGESGGGGSPASPTGADSGSAAPGGTALTDETLRELEQLGPDGVAAATLAQRTAPGGPGGQGGAGGAGEAGLGGPTATSADSVGGSGITEAIGEILSGSSEDGMGVALPAMLGLGLLAAAAIGVFRLRRRSLDA